MPCSSVAALYHFAPSFLPSSHSVLLMNNEDLYNPVAQIVPAVGYSSPVLIK